MYEKLSHNTFFIQSENKTYKISLLSSQYGAGLEKKKEKKERVRGHI